MEENFKNSLSKILRYEGGFSNHPLDKGGPTNLGITLSTLKTFYHEYGYGDFNEDGDVNIDDIELLDSEKVEPIYKKYYWDKLNLDNFPGGVDFLMFDFSVNSGPKNAAKILQRAINRQDLNLVVDGLLGPNTMSTINQIDKNQLIANMIQERELFYRKLVSINPSQNIFLKGWLNRLNNVSEEVGEFV